MSIDLTPLVQAAVSLAVIPIGAVGSWALARLGQRFGIQISDAQRDRLELAIEKSVQAGGMMLEQTAAAQGWEHPEFRSQVIETGLGYLVQHFPEALQRCGLDPANTADAAKLRDALTRAFPIAIAPVAASPATTNGPVAPV